MFLSIKNVLEKISEDQHVNALPYYFSPHFSDKGITFL